MSFAFCCREIDRLHERIEDLEALKELQFEELKTANELNAELKRKLAAAELKANCGLGPW